MHRSEGEKFALCKKGQQIFGYPGPEATIVPLRAAKVTNRRSAQDPVLIEVFDTCVVYIWFIFLTGEKHPINNHHLDSFKIKQPYLLHNHRC